MVSWTLFAFECADETHREELMEWFEENQPVEFPTDRYSIFADIETAEGNTRAADYAWVGRYLYITVMGDADQLIDQTKHLWERAAVAEFDGTTESVVGGTFILDTESEIAGALKGHRLEGPPEWAGNGLMYALAMKHQFRFRSYSAQSPTTQVTPHPDAFTVPTEFADDFEGFIEEISEVTGVEPTEEGMEFLRNDPADDDRYVYGETYGPVDDNDGNDGVDRVYVHDAETGETEEYRDADDVEEAMESEDSTTDQETLERFEEMLDE